MFSKFITPNNRSLHGTFNKLQVNLASIWVKWDGMNFDTEVSSAFIKRRMSRRRHDPA
jgi:hypothetical protein